MEFVMHGVTNTNMVTETLEKINHMICVPEYLASLCARCKTMPAVQVTGFCGLEIT
jgi:hypothetical protein